MEDKETQVSKAEQPGRFEKWHAPLTRVTPLSRSLAMALFVLLPFMGFWLGVEYAGRETNTATEQPIDPVVSMSGTRDVRETVPLSMSSSTATSSVIWFPSSLSQVVTAGQSTTTTATFTATEDARGVVVYVAPEVAPYVTVAPGSFANITKGASYPVTVTFTVPSTMPAGVTDGTIHLQHGKKTLAQPLPVQMEMGTRYQDDRYHFVLYFSSPSTPSEAVLDQPAVLRNTVIDRGDEESDILVTVYDNPQRKPIHEWYLSTLADKEFTITDSKTRTIRTVNVSGVPALQVESNIMGITMLRTYVSHDDVVIGICTWVADFLTVPPSYFSTVDSLKLF